jgi:hypothetical protein
MTAWIFKKNIIDFLSIGLSLPVISVHQALFDFIQIRHGFPEIVSGVLGDRVQLLDTSEIPEHLSDISDGLVVLEDGFLLGFIGLGMWHSLAPEKRTGS